MWQSASIIQPGSAMPLPEGRGFSSLLILKIELQAINTNYIHLHALSENKNKSCDGTVMHLSCTLLETNIFSFHSLTTSWVLPKHQCFTAVHIIDHQLLRAFLRPGILSKLGVREVSVNVTQAWQNVVLTWPMTNHPELQLTCWTR